MRHSLWRAWALVVVTTVGSSAVGQSGPLLGVGVAHPFAPSVVAQARVELPVATVSIADLSVALSVRGDVSYARGASAPALGVAAVAALPTGSGVRPYGGIGGGVAFAGGAAIPTVTAVIGVRYAVAERWWLHAELAGAASAWARGVSVGAGVAYELAPWW